MLPTLPADRRRIEPAPDWSETLPACWRSEAFAEDLADVPPAGRAPELEAPRVAQPSLVLLSLALVASTSLGGAWLVR
jgi:hypothetical protein